MRTKLFLTQIKREFWEHKTGFVYAPLLITGLVLLILLVAVFYSREIIGAIAHDNISTEYGCTFRGGCKLEYKNSDSSGASSMAALLKKRDFESMIVREPSFMGAPLWIAIGVNCALLVITYCIVLSIYAHATLLDDRKSRDILFWRSMPVSETVNVVVKLGIIIILPAVALLLSSLLVGLCASAATVGALSLLDAPVATIIKSIIASGAQWAPLKIAGVGLLMFLLLLPVFSFFLFCSALAKKSPVLLSSVLPIGVWFLDSILADIGVNLHVREVWRAYSDVLARVLTGFMDNPNGEFAAVGLQAYSVIFVVAAVFICGAIWLRNNRYEI